MKADAYDVPAALEGEHMGLIEKMAARLWRQRRNLGRNAGKHETPEWSDQTDAVKSAWRATAQDVLQMLFDIGMVGPGGKPDAARFEGWTYGWHYAASEWQIMAADGGYVALVRETPDLEVMLAAPAMATAIRDLGATLAGSPALEQPAIAALFAALPEKQNPGVDQ